MSEKLPVPIHYRKGLEAVGLYAVIVPSLALDYTPLSGSL